MTNQINVGIQRQSYEAHENYEAVDSEAENSNADASLADDSAGANTGGNPNVVVPHSEGESVNPAAPETVATNNMLNRYGISDGIMIQRPEYTINNRATPAANPASAAPALPNESNPVCPDQTNAGSSGSETPPPANALAKSTGGGAKAGSMNAAPPVSHDTAAYQTARDFGLAHGYSELKIDKLAAVLHFEGAASQPRTLASPDLLSQRLDLTPVNKDGSFDIAAGQLSFGRAMVWARARPAPQMRPPPMGTTIAPGQGILPDNNIGMAAGRGGLVPATSDGITNNAAAQSARPTPGFSGSGDGGSGPWGGGNDNGLGPGPGSGGYGGSVGAGGYGGGENIPPPDFNPLPSLPPVDTNGPIMLPPPDIRLDPVLAPLPNISVADPFQQTAGNTGVGNSSGNNLSGNVGANGFNNTGIGDPSQQSGGNTNTPVNTNAGGGATNLPLNDDAPDEEISLTPEEAAGLPRTSIEIGPLRAISTPSTPSKPEGQRIFMGLNANGEPIYSSSSLPSQGEYRAAPDQASLPAGDPVLRADATGATPLRDENGTLFYRVNGGAMDGQIIHVRPTTSSPQIEQPATTLETGGTADRSGGFSLGFAPLAAGSTATTRLAGQLASQVLAAEMEFGPPQLRVAAAATLTGVALWAAGRQNSEYEALSPEERERLRQPLINVPPPPLPPFPGLVPPPVPDNSILPGTSTQPNNLPPLGGFQIAPPQTIDDLIIESRRAPNGSAHANGYDYEFDGNSRIENVEGDLSREDGTRSRTHQSGAGGTDRLPDDDGGHIVGNRFNPPGEEFNYVAQNSNFNRGSYRQLENEWAQLLADGHTVHVRWDFEYSGDSQRPDGFNVTYHVDGGEPVVRQFQNRHGGK